MAESQQINNKNQIIYLVSVPIGNNDDISLRALKLLKSVDFIICEEYKEAGKLLRYLGIRKELVSLNEHNQENGSQDIITEYFNKDNISAALISDAGTPVFNDPGYELVKLCIDQGIKIVPVPGASSLMPALIGSGLKLDNFYYAGWLSQKSEMRQNELFLLKNIHTTIVLYETPYRLKKLLDDILNVFGKHMYVVIAYELTTARENFFRGSIEKIIQQIEENYVKGNFVLLLKNY